MHMFRYFPPSSVSILERGLMCFTPPTYFNDPFEMSPQVIPVRHRSHIKHQAEDYVRESRERLNRRFGQHLGRRERRKKLAEFKKGMAKAIKDASVEFACEAQDAVLPNVANRYGVLCLTAVPDSLLMWAHYAQGHRGFVIEFDADHPSFATELGEPEVVRYSVRRSVYDLEREVPPDFYLSKSIEWAYEKEWRVVRRLDLCDSILVDEKNYYVRRMPFGAVVSIRCGCKTEETTKQDICFLAQKPELRHTKLYQTRVGRTEFKLDLVESTP